MVRGVTLLISLKTLSISMTMREVNVTVTRFKKVLSKKRNEHVIIMVPTIIQGITLVNTLPKP